MTRALIGGFQRDFRDLDRAQEIPYEPNQKFAHLKICFIEIRALYLRMLAICPREFHWIKLQSILGIVDAPNETTKSVLRREIVWATSREFQELVVDFDCFRPIARGSLSGEFDALIAMAQSVLHSEVVWPFK
ncbi:hypothetical protein M5K25_018104 [Dendrobium thyrsiflorum]|uniref:Uncharacterized protein n=1 Tax=Dendrobium thyrsiflorum TaxID=117978 RepID=A0ABD0UHS8_DENTH